MTSYIPHSDEDVRAMLSAVGAASLEELFSDVPKELLLKKDLDILDEHTGHFVSRLRVI